MRALVLLSALTLSSCGYQLIEPTLEPVPVHVTVRDAGAPLLAATLRQRLALRGLIQPGNTTVRTISLRAEATERRLLAIDSAGRAAEYREEHEVQARAHWLDDKPGDWRAYRAIRDYAYDESIVLGKDQERELILGEMRIELADRIIENLIYDAVDTLIASEPVD